MENPATVYNLTRREVSELLEDVQQLLEKEPKLVDLPPAGHTVFVGDTHGDFEATKIVIKRHMAEGVRLVFLGDYVDRGHDSAANINYLLSLKLAQPNKLILLQGNHEGYGVFRVSPANFWESIDKETGEEYERVLRKLPLGVSIGEVIGLHGALPDVRTLAEVNDIRIGDKEWKQITWGDWQEIDGDVLGEDKYTGRPQFGRGYFDRLMGRFGKGILIRSHQAGVPQWMYERRCLTIFTSKAYVLSRTIGILQDDERRETVDRLRIESV